MRSQFRTVAVTAAVAQAMAACGGGSASPPVAPTVTLTSSATDIAVNGVVTLTWSSTNTTACTPPVGEPGMTVGPAGAQSVAVAQTSTYSISCTGRGGVGTASVTVRAWRPPTASIVADPTAVLPNETVRLTWSSQNATTCTGSGGLSGTLALTGSQSSAPLATTTVFRIACSNPVFDAGTSSVTVRALAYEIRELGVYAALNSVALRDINARSEVSGDGSGFAGIYYPFYSPPQWVQLSASGFPNRTGAAGINNNGQVAGFGVRTQWGPATAIVMTQSGVIDLGTLGGTQSFASDINDSGQVTGISNVIDPTFPSGEAEHAFISAPGVGVLTDLGTFGGGQSRGAGINQSGQVTGSSTVDRFGTGSTWLHWRAFLYSNGQMINLGTLGGDVSMGSAINDRAQVTGFSETPTPDVFHAFLWSEGVMTDLGTLGGKESRGNAISYEEVTGYATTATGVRHAFWYLNGRMWDLNALVVDDPLAKYVTLQEGVAINDSHIIVAQGLDSRGGGGFHWYLLLPKF